MKRFRVVLLGATAAVLIVATAASAAPTRFKDVPADHTFSVAINWMDENGITVGCNPPANDMFCPAEYVTRGQMSAFLKRLVESDLMPAGPQGPKGDIGAQGLPGLQGIQGLPGLPGADGADGAQGPQGLPGADGEDGADGAQGPQGLPGADGEDGAQGPQGEVGPQGPKGDTGDQGPAGIVTITQVTASSLNDSSGSKTVVATCAAGSVIGGGARVTGASPSEILITGSYPSSDTDWTATAIEMDTVNGNWQVIAYAICA